MLTAGGTSSSTTKRRSHPKSAKSASLTNAAE
jgi:hypothetical protein